MFYLRWLCSLLHLFWHFGVQPWGTIFFFFASFDFLELKQGARCTWMYDFPCFSLFYLDAVAEKTDYTCTFARTILDDLRGKVVNL